MCLTILKELRDQRSVDMQTFPPGAWFADSSGQIYLVVLDDQTHENRILCLGSHYQPFLTNIPLYKIDIDRSLMPGTILQITDRIEGGYADAK